jgi:hypothetical protein
VRLSTRARFNVDDPLRARQAEAAAKLPPNSIKPLAAPRADFPEHFPIG